MAISVITLTGTAYPYGRDETDRQAVLYGTATFSASPATYQTGGIAVPWGKLSTNRFTSSFATWAEFQTSLGSGYVYLWTIASLRKNSTAYVAGQVFNYTASNGLVYLMQCTTAGTSASSLPTSINTATNGTWTDGTVTWTCEGLSGGVLQIFTGAAAQSALTELTGNAAIPAAVSSDILVFRAEFARF